MGIKVFFQDKLIKKLLDDMSKASKELDSKTNKVRSLIGAVVFKDIMSHFTKTQNPGGTPWPRWTNAYDIAQARRGRFQRINILRDTGTLRKGIIPFRKGDNTRSVPDGILFYNPVPYSAIHDEGGIINTKYARIKMPQRSFMWMSDTGMDNLAEQILKFMAGGSK